MEQAARNGKQLIGQWGKACRKDNPEIPLIIKMFHLQETLLAKDIGEEAFGYYYDYYDLVEVKSKVRRIDDNINFSAEEYNRPKGEYLKGNGDVQTRIIKKKRLSLHLEAIKNVVMILST